MIVPAGMLSAFFLQFAISGRSVCLIPMSEYPKATPSEKLRSSSYSRACSDTTGGSGNGLRLVETRRKACGLRTPCEWQSEIRSAAVHERWSVELRGFGTWFQGAEVPGRCAAEHGHGPEQPEGIAVVRQRSGRLSRGRTVVPPEGEQDLIDRDVVAVDSNDRLAAGLMVWRRYEGSFRVSRGILGGSYRRKTFFLVLISRRGITGIASEQIKTYLSCFCT